MKKKKGFTLIEIIVSMILLSVVLLFLFQLLLLLRSEDNVSTSASVTKSITTQLNISLQKSIFENNVTNIVECSSENERCYNISFSNDEILVIKLNDAKKVISFLKYDDSTKRISMYETYQLPNNNYIGNLKINSITSENNLDYNIPYDSILKISILILDEKCNDYKIEAFFPFLSTNNLNLKDLNFTSSNIKNSCK